MFKSSGVSGLGLAARGLGLLAAGYAMKRVVEGRRLRLHGRVVLITGGSRGLGLLLGREFGRRGGRIAICARDAAELERGRLNLERRGIEVYATVCDVSDAEQVQRLIHEVEDYFGRIDVLVNNASIIQVGPVEAMKIEDFQHAMAVNFWGTLHTSLAAIDALKKNGGSRIVNICSIGGKVAVPHLLPYDCAKFAVMGLSEGLRAELAKDNISVTTVIPGLMRTGSFSSATFKGDPMEEYLWFSTLAQGAVTSMDGRKAARKIVRAAMRRDAEVIIGWQARLLAFAKAFFPATVARALSAANRAMPKETGYGEFSGRSLAVDPARYS
jgi:short-subunit dehydrogenase